MASTATLRLSNTRKHGILPQIIKNGPYLGILPSTWGFQKGGVNSQKDVLSLLFPCTYPQRYPLHPRVSLNGKCDSRHSLAFWQFGLPEPTTGNHTGDTGHRKTLSGHVQGTKQAQLRLFGPFEKNGLFHPLVGDHQQPLFTRRRLKYSLFLDMWWG